jgi:diaminohydroxyphosphoribosylaminopyrimidine deaminase/5-amino-6-(5-phosphoribosylamino)uracil reductase
VVVGALDPNPKHSGRAIPILRDADIKITTGILQQQCEELNRPFNKWIVCGMPWVIAKAGMSLDGRLTRPPGEGQWLSSEASRADAMKLRAKVDAILIGGETLRTDNPRLTIRGVPGFERKQPWRVVLTRSGNLPESTHVFTDRHRNRTVVYQRKSLNAALRALGKRQITSVLIEGGGRILGEAVDHRVVDELHVYLSPLLCGGPGVIGGHGAGATGESILLKHIRYDRIDDDIHITAYT